jgi:GAF domain-containing protein
LIRHRFGFYHAQVFLVDDKKENAALVASTGAAGRELLARKHSLPVGSQSVIGQVTSRGEPVIASDTDSSVVHKRNELLPDTRSEMALPMRIGDQIIGALDLQSVAPNAFDQDDVAVFQIMADQLAIALENARLYGALETAQTTVSLLERRITSEAWHSYRQSRDENASLAYEYEDDRLEPYVNQSPMPLGQAIQTGQLVALDDGEQGISLAVPIKVRGEVIGAFGFGGETVRKLTGDDVALVEAVVDRVGLALENLRLMEQTSRRAEHEQVINAITAKIVGTTDVSQILQTTVRELGRVLRTPQTSVQLRREKLDDSYE